MLLLTADVVLVALALRPPDEAPGTSGVSAARPTARSATTDGSRASASASPGERPSTESAPSTIDIVPLTLQLAAVSSDVAWRVSSSPCGDDVSERDATVEVSTDGGTSWTAADRPDAVVARLSPTSATRAFVVSAAQASSCDTRFRSTTNGTSWSSATDADDRAWFRDPSDPSRLHLPSGRLVTPCGADGVLVDLSVSSASSAGVLCRDGRVERTTDTGRSFEQRARVEGALALTGGAGDAYLVAVVGRGSCDGIGLVEVGVKTTGRACAPRDVLAVDDLEPGRVSVSSADDAVWLAAGDVLLRSTDGGRGLSRR